MINKRLIVFITSILFLLASCTNTSPKPIANDDSAFSSATEQDSSEQETPELEIFVDAPDTVLSGDEFTITFTVNDDARKFDRPSFDGFSFLGQSSQSLNINGNKSTSISYTLVSNQEGSFEIGPASCISNGKKITSSKFTINVVKPTATQQKQREKQQKQLQQQQLQQLRQIQQQQRSLMDQFDQLLNTNPLRQQPSFSEPENTKDIIFVRSFLSSTNPYQGDKSCK